MKKVFSLILALGLIASLTACGGGNASGNETGDSAPAASTAKLRFVTGGESGTYYAFGSVIAQHATNNTDVSVTGLVGNGSKSNVEELADGNAELAFCQSDVMAYAYNGTNLFESPIDCFSTVAALYMEDVQIVTTDPSIKTVADLAGKNVSVGAAGSGVYFNAVDILSAYGLGDLDADGKFTKINATYQSFGDSADSLKDGKIDAAFIVAGGLGSLTGSILGSAVITVLLEWLRAVEDPITLGGLAIPGIPGMRMVVFSLVLLCIILYRREGIMGMREITWDAIFDFFSRRKRA